MAQKTRAQSSDEPGPVQTFYLSTNLNGNILSTSFLSKGGSHAKLTPIRYSGFLTIGVNVNHDFSQHFGIYSGLNIKNIGFIEHIHTLTIKRRDYTIGLPLGLKIGDIINGNYLLIGGGVDFPFNYREKQFVKRNDKTKFNEWFSERTPAALGYVFVGMHFHPGFYIKLQYYPGNFLNPEFMENVGGIPTQPYANYDVHLLFLSFGMDLPFRPHETLNRFKGERDLLKKQTL